MKVNFKSFFLLTTILLFVDTDLLAIEFLKNKLAKPSYDVELVAPCGTEGVKFFILYIQNKSDKPIEINWNKTLFIWKGQTYGGFMFEGIVYKDRNNPKPPDVVLPKSLLKKAIYPCNLVEFERRVPIYLSGWSHESMGKGKHGVYLVLSLGEKEISEVITFELPDYCEGR